MDQITHEVRLANWKQIIEECHARPEGQSAKQWLSERGISTKSYYYWQRKLRLQAYDQMKQSQALPTVQEDPAVTFAEIPFSAKSDTPETDHFHPTAVIRSGGMTVALSNSVSDGLLARILQEVRHA